MKSFSFFLLFLLSFSLYAQEKYLIYFKDKGEELHKASSIIQIEKNLRTEFSQKAIERRKKVSVNNFLYEDYPVSESYINNLKNYKVYTINRLNWLNAISVLLTKEQMNEIKDLSYIKSIEKVKSYRVKSQQLNSLFSVMNSLYSPVFDYGYSSNQNSLHNVQIIHNAGISGKDVLIGIIDTGFKWKTHESLKSLNVLAEYDFIFKDTVTENENPDVSGQDDHGTYVLSVAGGKFDGKLVGPAFSSSYLLAKTEDIRSESKIEEDNYAAALEWMEKKGVDIINCSLGYNEFDNSSSNYVYSDMNGNTTISAKATNIATSLGVIVVSSAGNEGNKSWKFITTPADAFKIISVGAVDINRNLAGFSSLGPTADGRIKPEVCAMGVSVYGASSSGNSNYSFASGTSAAAPIVAGVSALLLSLYPELDINQVRDAFKLSSGNATSPNNFIGWGIIDAVELLSFPEVIKKKLLNDSVYFLFKSIFSENLNPQSVSLYLNSTSGNYVKYPMNITSIQNKFQINLSGLVSETEKVKFYIEYKTTDNTIYRYPRSNDKICYLVLKDKKVSIEDLKVDGHSIVVNNAYPLPFNPNIQKLTLELQIPSSFSYLNNVYIDVFNILGEKVKTIESNSNFSSGKHYIYWDGRSDFNNVLSSGIYFVRFKGDNFSTFKKVIVAK